MADDDADFASALGSRHERRDVPAGRLREHLLTSERL
jgi:hypothetical protein